MPVFSVIMGAQRARVTDGQTDRVTTAYMALARITRRGKNFNVYTQTNTVP